MRFSFLAALGAAAGAFQCASVSLAGPYTEAGIPGSSSSFVEWANSFTNLIRGPQDIANPGGAAASFGSGNSALGTPNGTDVVSLGDGGRITLGFATPIANGPGADFAVFENGLSVGGNVFAELAYVEVSSDGTNFFRFPSVSLTPTDTQVGSFGTIDPTNVHNLAGKDIANVGTGFDLTDLAGVSPSLNVNDITAVRLIDVVGRIAPIAGSYTPSMDSASPSDIINDPYPTAFASGGFDLDAVGVINTAPEPSMLLSCVGIFLLGHRRRK
jgi:hypothetical protein